MTGVHFPLPPLPDELEPGLIIHIHLHLAALREADVVVKRTSGDDAGLLAPGKFVLWWQDPGDPAVTGVAVLNPAERVEVKGRAAA